MSKLIVITGGSKGIGKAIIEKFAANGFDVATCARNVHDLEVLEQEIVRKYSVKFHYKQANMSDRSQVKAFVNFVLQLNKGIDILVNNAGYFVPGELCTEPEGTLESMINANVYSAYYTTRGFADQMKLNKSGHIFNICSIASIKAYANGGSYAISKFALLGFSKCLREELKNYNIRVTSVLPGATFTRSWEGVDLPESRFMPVEDIAETIYNAYTLSKRTVVEEILIRPQLGDI